MFRYYSTRERDWEIIYAEEKNNTASDKLPLLLLSSSSSSWHLAEDERECRNAIFRLLERVCISSVISRFPYSSTSVPGRYSTSHWNIKGIRVHRKMLDLEKHCFGILILWSKEHLFIYVWIVFATTKRVKEKREFTRTSSRRWRNWSIEWKCKGIIECKRNVLMDKEKEENRLF